MERKTRVVILGGGFGGLYTALHLERTLARDPNVEITLVSRENFFLFTPMLHEVAASDLDLTHIVNPVRKMLARVQFFCGNIESVDLERRVVNVAHGGEHHDHELPYDHLVLALGSVTRFPKLERDALAMKSLGDAIDLRNRLIEALEIADFECCAHLRGPLLTVVVAGGGFAGVETIAAVNDFLKNALRFYRNLGPEQLRLVLVHSGDTILPELGPELGRYAQERLAARGIEIVTGVRVSRYSDAGVELSDGSRLPAGMLVWTAGTAPNPLLEGLPCPLDRGRVRVDATLAVPEWPGVWALGDCAVVPDPRTGEPYPPTAQHALRQGKVLAHNIAAAIRGGTRKAFVFNALGQLASIGRRTGVARVFGVNFSGFIAWWLWRTIYLLKLPRLEKKLRVMLDWSLDLVFTKDLVQFKTFRTAHAEPAAPAPAEAPAELVGADAR